MKKLTLSLLIFGLACLFATAPTLACDGPNCASLWSGAGGNVGLDAYMNRNVDLGSKGLDTSTIGVLNGRGSVWVGPNTSGLYELYGVNQDQSETTEQIGNFNHRNTDTKIQEVYMKDLTVGECDKASGTISNFGKTEVETRANDGKMASSNNNTGLATVKMTGVDPQWMFNLDQIAGTEINSPDDPRYQATQTRLHFFGTNVPSVPQN